MYRLSRLRLKSLLSVAVFCLALLLVGCNSDFFLSVNQGMLTLRLSTNGEGLVLVIEGEPVRLDVSLARQGETGPVNLTLSGLPTGVTAEIAQPGILNEGSITFQATRDAAPQSDVRVVVTASDGAEVDTAEVFLDIVRP